MRAPPLEFKDSFTFCAYANRRIFSGLGIRMGDSNEEEASLGKWQKGQTMSTHYYSAHNERLSFGIKSKPIKACKLAAKKHGRIQSLETAWNFAWGDIPAYAPSLSDFKAEATEQARDISVVIPTEQFNVVLPASFCPRSTPKCKPDPPPEERSTPVSDDESYLDDSVAGGADEAHIFDLFTVARSTVLACGSMATSKVHLLGSDDNGSSDTVSIQCKTRLKRNPKVQIETAELFIFGKHVPCLSCQKI